jgi:hypothetical protein
VEEISLMKKFAFVLALSMTVTGLAVAVEPTLFTPGTGSQGPSGSDREVIWEAPPDYGLGAGSSEMYEDLDSELANDFIIDPDPVVIMKIEWWGQYYQNPPNDPAGDALGFNLRFYLPTGCFPQNDPFALYAVDHDCCETPNPDGDPVYEFMYEYCLDLPLEPGLYWFSAQCLHFAYPQWGRKQAADAFIYGACEDAFRSVYFGVPDWVPFRDLVGQPHYEVSVRFHDECVPTATETSSWGLIKGLYR